MDTTLVISENAIEEFKNDLTTSNSGLTARDLGTSDGATTIAVNSSVHTSFEEQITLINEFKGAAEQEITNLDQIKNDFIELDDAIATDFLPC